MQRTNLTCGGFNDETWVHSVASNGSLAFSNAFDSLGRKITVVDTLGVVRARFGRKGQGPEELGGFVQVEFTPDDRLVVSDGERARFFVFDSLGTLLFSSDRLNRIGYPLQVGSDSVDLLLIDGSTGAPAAIGRASLKDGGIRTILVGEPMTDSSSYAAHNETIIAANAFEYSIQSFGPDGIGISKWSRALPPVFMDAERVQKLSRGNPVAAARLAAQQERHFRFVRHDDRGRLWLLMRNGTTVDVMADTAYVGQIELPCSPLEWRFSSSGHWLALLCTAKGTVTGVSLRLFRIVG